VKYFEIVTKFRYLAKTAEYRNFIHEDSKMNARFGTLRAALLSIHSSLLGCYAMSHIARINS